MIVAKLHAVQPRPNVRKTLEITDVFARSAAGKPVDTLALKLPERSSQLIVTFQLRSMGAPTTVVLGRGPMGQCQLGRTKRRADVVQALHQGRRPGRAHQRTLYLG